MNTCISDQRSLPAAKLSLYRSRPRRFALALECLEDRSLLSAGAFLQGTAFIDTNGNGRFDPTESGQAGAIIRLYTQDGGTLLGEATTGADGRYLFDDSTVFNGNLTAGTYLLVQTPPQGFIASGTQDDSLLHPSVPISAAAIQVTIIDPTQITATLVSFGVTEGVSITFNGVQRNLQIGQFQISLQGPGLPQPSPAFFSFCVDITQTVGVRNTFGVLPLPADTGLLNNGGRIAYLYNTFGTTALNSVQGAGLQLAIWELEYDAVPNLASGNFQFNGAPVAGTEAAIRAAANAYLSASTGMSGVAIFLDATRGGMELSHSGRQSFLAPGAINFANTPFAAIIGGVKFQDMNGNGVRDDGEPGMAGWTIFLDTNNNGKLDVGETRTTTDANGGYRFSDLTPGVTYVVREVQQAGYVQTTVNPAAIVATNGLNVTDAVFGNFKLISISGTKFRDGNGNGVRGPLEVGLAGWKIYLDANDNGQWDDGEIVAKTDAQGNFRFTNLGPGTYRVREVNQLGWIQMTNFPADIDASSGGDVTGVLFGNMPVPNVVGPGPGKLLLTGRYMANLRNGTFARQAQAVADLYHNLLGRAPDLAGLRRYMGLMQTGTTIQGLTPLFRTDFRLV